MAEKQKVDVGAVGVFIMEAGLIIASHAGFQGPKHGYPIS